MWPAMSPNGWDSIRQMLANPQLGAALIQGGSQLLQPRELGQSGLGHVAQAVGAGAETFARRDAMDQERQRAEREDERLRMQGEDQNLDRSLRRDQLALQEKDVNSQIASRAAMSDIGRLKLENVFKARQDYVTKNAVNPLTGEARDPNAVMQEAITYFPDPSGKASSGAAGGDGGAKAKSTATPAPSVDVTPSEEPPLQAPTKGFLDLGLFGTGYDPVEATGRELSGLGNMVAGFFRPQGDAAKLAKPQTPNRADAARSKAGTQPVTPDAKAAVPKEVAPGVPTISTKEQYDSLPVGASYYHAGKKQVLVKGG